MPVLRIVSFNIKNELDKNKKEEQAKAMVQLVRREHIQILGCQELTKEYEPILKQALPEYRFYGKYRFGNLFFSRNPYNENNFIITNQKVLEEKTIWLPFLPMNWKECKEMIQKRSFAPRIATIVKISVSSLEFFVINTHLEYKIHSIKVRELRKIEKWIKKHLQFPILLMGDFNLQEKDEDFSAFIERLSFYQIKKVPIQESSWRSKKGTERKIDHIFLPQNWNILSHGSIPHLDISDHDPVYVDVSL